MADIEWLDGGVTAVPGFLAGGVAGGIKPSGRKDLALIYSSSQARAAAVFTSNQVKGAPVLVSMDHIRGGTAQSYYVGIESSLPAVPGAPPPLKALCVVPFGMEEGTETDVPKQEFGLIVGEPVEFRFLVSVTRRHDAVGNMVEEWQDEIQELAPVSTTFDSPGNEGKMVPVHLHSKVTEVGTLELW